jgi:integrase
MNKAGTQTAWIADYFDQAGKRHIKTFDTRKAATAWLDEAKFEVKQGIHTPENASITVAEAAEIWIEKSELEKLERSTLRQYRNHVDLHIKPSRIGSEKLARLSARRSRLSATTCSAKARVRWPERCSRA